MQPPENGDTSYSKWKKAVNQSVSNGAAQAAKSQNELVNFGESFQTTLVEQPAEDNNAKGTVDEAEDDR